MEGLICTRASLSARLLYWSQQTRRADPRTWNMIASLIGTHNYAETAAHLDYAQGSWATIFGHTHHPLALKLELVRDDDQRRAHLVGNGGNINRKRPGCVVARFPEVCVYRYRHETDELFVAHRARLDRDEIQLHEAVFEAAARTAQQPGWNASNERRSSAVP